LFLQKKLKVFAFLVNLFPKNKILVGIVIACHVGRSRSVSVRVNSS
jgi:protein-tyrosine phosphatase